MRKGCARDNPFSGGANVGYKVSTQLYKYFKEVCRNFFAKRRNLFRRRFKR